MRGASVRTLVTLSDAEAAATMSISKLTSLACSHTLRALYPAVEPFKTGFLKVHCILVNHTKR